MASAAGNSQASSYRYESTLARFWNNVSKDSSLNSNTDMVPDRMKGLAFDFVEVLIDILIWQVATNEHAIDEAVSSDQIRQGTGALLSLQVV
jgi:hypothetical protein